MMKTCYMLLRMYIPCLEDFTLIHVDIRGVKYNALTRTSATYIPLRHFDLAKSEDKHYTQQYGDMYFLRLAKLKPAVEQLAAEAWEGYQVRKNNC